MTLETYFFSIWLKRPINKVEKYLSTYKKELSSTSDPDALALAALLALAED